MYDVLTVVEIYRAFNEEEEGRWVLTLPLDLLSDVLCICWSVILIKDPMHLRVEKYFIVIQRNNKFLNVVQNLGIISFDVFIRIMWLF